MGRIYLATNWTKQKIKKEGDFMEEENNEKLVKAIIVISIILVAMLLIACIYIFSDPNYTVKYYIENEEIARYTYKGGESINMPDFKIKPGYKLVGWKTEKGEEYTIEQSVQVTKDITYYAMLEEIHCEHLNQVTRGQKDPTCAEEGYTGDIKCRDCGTRLQEGQSVPATGEHKFVASGKCKDCQQEAEYKITASNYGDKINYTSEGCNDWKVFYNDGRNVYIISSNYIEIPEKWRNSNSIYTFNAFKTDWYDGHIELHDGGYAFHGDMKKIFLDNMEDTSNWLMFFNKEFANSVQSGPTLDLFINSWNAKGYTKLYTTTDKDGENYISTTEGEKENGIKINTDDKLYFPYSSSIDNCTAYYLLTADVHSNIYSVDYIGRIGGTSLDIMDERIKHTGLRPVVCLKTDCGFTYENGVWQLN